MLRRVDTLCLVAIALIGMLLPSASATSEASNRTLKGITAVNVLVEKLPSGAQVLGVTEEAIRTDVELKLRLAGMRVVTESESSDQPGSPFIYVLLEVTDSARAAHIELKLE